MRSKEIIVEAVTGFQSNSTGMPFYDEMMDNPEYFERAKRLLSNLTMMSPKEYVSRCAEGFKKTKSQIIDQRDKNLAMEYAQKMLDGEKFPILTLDYTRGDFSQEGLHRAMAAFAAKIPEVPVLIVTRKEE